MTVALAFVLLSEGWNLLAGYAGQLSLGTAGFFGLGAYAYAISVQWYNISSIPAVLLGGTAAAGLSALVAAPLFRLRQSVFAIGTLGLAEILGVIFLNWNAAGGDTGFPITNVPYDPYGEYYLAVVCTVLVIIAMAVVLESKFGRGLRAIRDDEDAAESLGVPVLRYKIATFCLSSFIIGTAGGIYAGYTFYATPDMFGPLWTAEVLVICVVGGLATLEGPAFMSVVYVVLLFYVLSAYPVADNFIYAALLIVVIVLLPGGIASLYRKESAPKWWPFTQGSQKPKVAKARTK